METTVDTKKLHPNNCQFAGSRLDVARCMCSIQHDAHPGDPYGSKSPNPMEVIVTDFGANVGIL